MSDSMEDEIVIVGRRQAEVSVSWDGGGWADWGWDTFMFNPVGNGGGQMTLEDFIEDMAWQEFVDNTPVCVAESLTQVAEALDTDPEVDRTIIDLGYTSRDAFAVAVDNFGMTAAEQAALEAAVQRSIDAGHYDAAALNYGVCTGGIEYL